MTSFDARLRVSGQSGFPLGVEIDLTGQRMVVTAGESRLANWNLQEIRILSLPDGFHVLAEGEEVILNVTDGATFAAAISRRSRSS